MSLTPLLEGSDVPTKIDLHWPDALPAATTDSYGYWRELNPDLLGVSPSP